MSFPKPSICDKLSAVLNGSKLMDVADQIGSRLSALMDAVGCPSVAELPIGFLVLVLAVFTSVALPEGAREKVRIAGITAIALIVSIKLSSPVDWLAILR
jgi:hypothetical protein